MTQQYQPQGQSMQGTGQMGQYGGTSQQGMGGAGQQGDVHIGQQEDMHMGQRGGMQMGMRLSEFETPQQRAAVEGISRAIQVCGWCADQCIQEADPQMTECIRLCEDVTELGETALALLPRGSWYTDSILQTFTQAAEACAQECGQHPHGHCQECAEVLWGTVDSVQQFAGGQGQQASTF